jgi:hypothetical protein
MSIVGENWSSLRNQLFIFDFSHAHRSLPIGGFVPYTTETRFVFQYPMLPRFMSVKIVNKGNNKILLHIHLSIPVSFVAQI